MGIQTHIPCVSRDIQVEGNENVNQLAKKGIEMKRKERDM
jgi:hypothetical protein